MIHYRVIVSFTQKIEGTGKLKKDYNRLEDAEKFAQRIAGKEFPVAHKEIGTGYITYGPVKIYKYEYPEIKETFISTTEDRK